MIEKYFFILVALCVISCNAQKQHVSVENRDNVPLMEELNGFQKSTSPTGEFAAYYQLSPSTPQYPFELLCVKVVDIERQKVIFEKELRDGKIEWTEDYILVLDFSPVVISKDRSKNISKYILNVKTGEIVKTGKSQPHKK